MNLIFPKVITPEEIAELSRLAAEIWQEYYVSIITLEQIDYMIQQYQSVSAVTEQIHEQGYEYYFIQRDDAPVGYISVKVEEDRMFLSKFYIGKKHRGQGYASLAFAFLEQQCIERGINLIWLTVNRHNESSIAVYEKKGFRTVREQVADIGNGFVMDDFVMEKAIHIS
ncbi:GNAT family N-acetyltransferase [Paenibacillus sp. 7516]|uniref:GNAT family N-acetyltransferase n=1 Tax=Paenibacillus sp. 7516 TaxID=2022549 RepID=UPI000BA7800C|nr:GNAT family N-acetyltransferase [Paenibacillus sp. 7516]PAF32665.1 GNAT family N-acetyltransferase [Paenibacillus sp. 7516]